MDPILLATLSLAGLGLLVAVVLSVASALLHVPSDPLVEELKDTLPGINCGACGYSGCEAYAEAMGSGKEENVSLCAPGGREVADQLGSTLGLKATRSEEVAAFVRCQGDSYATHNRLSYQGIRSCRMASQLLGGPRECRQGCLAFGDCARACPYGAIHIQNEVAVVDPRLCRACTLCVTTCPKGLITMVSRERQTAIVACRNTEKGGVSRIQCQNACIACGLCVRNCPVDAIKIEDLHAVVDPEKCIYCRKCIEVCPTGAMIDHPLRSIEKLGEPEKSELSKTPVPKI